MVKLFSGAAVAISLGLMVAGCETTTPDGRTGGGTGTGARVAVSGSGDAVVAQGRKLYFGRCTACHAPEPVTDYSPAEWSSLIPEMAEESNLDSAQTRALRAYVMSYF